MSARPRAGAAARFLTYSRRNFGDGRARFLRASIGSTRLGSVGLGFPGKRSLTLRADVESKQTDVFLPPVAVECRCNALRGPLHKPPEVLTIHGTTYLPLDPRFRLRAQRERLFSI